ncbi:MAG: glycogen debranching protein GlgX [Chitinivibrionales bacterium]
MRSEILPGQSYPLGATVNGDGVNFCVFSQHCTGLELLLFDDVNDPRPSRVLTFDPAIHKTFYYWHMFVPGLASGQLYGYRARGPFEPHNGLRYDGTKVLLDPYVKAVAKCPAYDRAAAIAPGDNCARAFKGLVVDTSSYDWEDDTSLRIPYSRTVIYEMHVAGFTRHLSSGVAAAKRGTYDGLVEKIPYLKSLGITAVELLPIQQFDEQDAPESLKNYWGYSPLAFFAPHNGYGCRSSPLGVIDEFRDMVKALHKAGIEVILDVVFNHTTEGDHRGPTLSLKGFENPAYYILEQNPALYANFSGCGNTINSNYSIVRRLIIDCLCYWVTEMHVDGFRFDLASVMARGESGQLMANPPVIWSIDSDPILAGTKIIAEAWDAAGLYQVGSFIGDRFSEWNGQFRDDVRRFIRGDNQTVTKLASRIMGSPDIYVKSGHGPNRSINFITCHDGFTLNDLVSYNTKHNEANKQNNADGAGENFSWNCGAEGPLTGVPGADEAIERLRLRQIKNFYLILLASQGTPMLLMGDEVRRTQAGNNNAYCQDDPLSWFNWGDVKKNGGLLLFVKKLVHFTQRETIFQQERLLSTREAGTQPSIEWHGVTQGRPDWKEDSHSIAFSLCSPEEDKRFFVALNAYREPLSFELPRPASGGKLWRRIVDTSLPSPDDFLDIQSATAIEDPNYHLESRSAALLLEL